MSPVAQSHGHSCRAFSSKCDGVAERMAKKKQCQQPQETIKLARHNEESYDQQDSWITDFMCCCLNWTGIGIGIGTRMEWNGLVWYGMEWSGVEWREPWHHNCSPSCRFPISYEKNFYTFPDRKIKSFALMRYIKMLNIYDTYYNYIG